MAIKSRKTLFVLVLVGLLTAISPGGCSHVGGGETDAGTDTDADTDTDTDIDSDTDSDSDGDTDTDPCGMGSDTFVVESPPEGVMPTSAAICAEPSAVVESTLAARVTLDILGADCTIASGFLAIADDLQGKVVSVLEIAAVWSEPDGLAEMTVSDLAEADGGYSFTAEIPAVEECDPLVYQYETFLIAVQATLEIQCESGEPDAATDTKIVVATTYLRLCVGTDHPVWVASGGECTVCEMATEMAPSPVTEDGPSGAAALARAIEVAIEPVVAFGRSLVLVAEHGRSSGPVSYEWRCSGGELSDANLGGVVWKMPKAPGPHQIQVAVCDGGSAGVATLTWSHVA